ncbi:hypothetical protein QL285_058776 [Trifolium repens]|nr:hypothetical protein QL285_058776 [Trifolium repens]
MVPSNVSFAAVASDVAPGVWFESHLHLQIFCSSAQFAWLRPLLALLPPGFSICRLPHNVTTWSFEKALSCATKVPSPL